MKEINYKEDIKLLLSEGINFLEFKTEILDINNMNLINMKFEDYISNNIPLIASERITYMLNDTQFSSYVKNIVSIFNQINQFINDKYLLFTKDKLVSIREFKDIFNEYCNMLKNNLELEDFREMFIGWCEDGNIFYERAERKMITLHSAGIEVILMKELSQKLDKYTNKLYENNEIIENKFDKRNEVEDERK